MSDYTIHIILYSLCAASSLVLMITGDRRQRWARFNSLCAWGCCLMLVYMLIQKQELVDLLYEQIELIKSKYA